MHLFLAIASLAFIGFVSMLTDVLLMIVAYSVYLAPRTWTCSLYLVLLVIGIIGEVADAFNGELQKSGAQRTGKVICAVIYGCQIFFTG